VTTPAAVPRLPRRVALVPAALVWLAAAGTTLLYLVIGAVLDGARDGQAPTGRMLAQMLACVAVVAVARYFAAWSGLAAVGPREVARRDALLDQLFRLGVAFRTSQRSGRFVSTATDGVERAAYYEATFLGPMIASTTAPLVALAMLGAGVDWQVAGWLALAVPGIPLVVGGFQRAFHAVSGEYRVMARRFAAQFLDGLQGLPTSTAFNRAQAKGVELALAAERLRRHVMQMLARNQLVLLVVDSAFSLAMITAAAGLAMARLRDGAITPGQAIAVVLVSTVLLEPLERIGQFFYVGMGGRASVREIAAVLDTVPEVTDWPGVVVPAHDSPRTDGRHAPALELRHVSFGYVDGAAVLRDVSLAVPRGSRVALIGPSGSGKTTVAALVQGHLRPDDGTVHVLGHDAADVPLTWLRSQISVVAQSTYLFTGSIAENLRLAGPDAPDELLWHVLAEANLADHVRSLPEGLATVVGERGASMSGGQAQRIAVARALLKDAPVLVLDEPTSQVDAESEAAVVDALERASRGRSLLVVAHRLTTVREVDEVVVLAGGQVVERGRPHDLGSIDSYYSRAHDLAGIADPAAVRR